MDPRVAESSLGGEEENREALSVPAVPSALESSHFNVDHLTEGLSKRSARGAMVTVTSQAARFVLQMASSAVLSRLLTPEDYGLVGMVSSVTGILTVFGTFGISGAIVQCRELNQRQMSTLFWLNVVIGLGLTVLAMALAVPIALGYHDPRIMPVTMALGVGFLIGGLGVQHSALLKRQMRFGALSLIDIVAAAGGGVAGIVFALAHFGYWSLVLMQLVVLAISCGASWLACGWRPELPSRKSGIAKLVSFGSNLTFFNALNYFVRNGDNVLIGWRWGPSELGQYSKAYNLLLFPLGQISVPIANVAIPALSRLQDDPARYRRYYLKGLNLIAYVTIPLILGLGVFSKEIVYILLGPQWSKAAHLFAILAVAAVFQPVANTTGWLYTSLERTGLMARWALLTSPWYIVAFLIGLPWGATGVAISYTVLSVLFTYLCFPYAVRGTPVSMSDIGGAIWRPTAVGGAMGAVMFGSRFVLGSLGDLPRLIGSVAAGILVMLLLRFAWPSVRGELDGILATARTIFQSRK